MPMNTNLIASLIWMWHSDEDVKNSCRELVKSMPEQLHVVIESKGCILNINSVEKAYDKILFTKYSFLIFFSF